MRGKEKRVFTNIQITYMQKEYKSMKVNNRRCGKLRIKGRYLDLLLVLLSINILTVVIYNINIPPYEPDAFFYIKNLPYYYYLGLIIVVATLIKNIFDLNKKYMNIALIISLCFYLGGIKQFILSGLPTFDIYGVMLIINNMVNIGHITQEHTIYPSEYPISIIFFCMLKLIGGFSSEQLLDYYQSSVSIITPMLILLISSSVCKVDIKSYNKFIFVPSFIISISLANILAPLSYAIIIYEIYLYVYFEQLKHNRINHSIILITLSVLIILTNPTTAYILLAGHMIPSLISFKELRIKLSNIFLLYGSLLLSQTIYRSESTTNAIATSILNVLSQDISSTNDKINITSPDMYYIIEYRLYILKVIIIILLSIVVSGLIIKKINKNNYKLSEISFFLSSCLISYIILFMISFIALPQFMERPLSFIIILLSISLPYFMLEIGSIKGSYKHIVVSILTLLILISVLNSGWNESYNRISQTEIYGRDFLHLHKELKITNEWIPKDTYIKRVSNLKIIRHEYIKGYLENIDIKHSIYNNGNFIIFH